MQQSGQWARATNANTLGAASQPNGPPLRFDRSALSLGRRRSLTGGRSTGIGTLFAPLVVSIKLVNDNAAERAICVRSRGPLARRGRPNRARRAGRAWRPLSHGLGPVLQARGRQQPRAALRGQSLGAVLDRACFWAALLPTVCKSLYKSVLTSRMSIFPSEFSS